MRVLDNPFFILKVSPRDDKRKITEQYTQLSLLSDNEKLSNAQSMLLNPRKRLSAEMNWFPGLAQEEIDRIISAARQGAPLEGYPPGLGSVNRLRLRFEAIDPSSIVEISTLLTIMDVYWSMLNRDSICAEINRDRQVAGFPDTNASAIEEELLQLRMQLRSDILEYLTARPRDSRILLARLSAPGAKGNNSYAGLMEDIISAYEISMQAEIGETAEAILRDLGHLRECRDIPRLKRESGPLVARIREWDDLAQPLQLFHRARGTTHEISLEIANHLRDFAIYLYNSLNLTAMSEKIMLAARDVFCELREFKERVDVDLLVIKKNIEMERSTGVFRSDDSSLSFPASAQSTPARPPVRSPSPAAGGSPAVPAKNPPFQPSARLSTPTVSGSPAVPAQKKDGHCVYEVSVSGKFAVPRNCIGCGAPTEEIDSRRSPEGLTFSGAPSVSMPLCPECRRARESARAETAARQAEYDEACARKKRRRGFWIPVMTLPALSVAMALLFRSMTDSGSRLLLPLAAVPLFSLLLAALTRLRRTYASPSLYCGARGDIYSDNLLRIESSRYGSTTFRFRCEAGANAFASGNGAKVTRIPAPPFEAGPAVVKERFFGAKGSTASFWLAVFLCTALLMYAAHLYNTPLVQGIVAKLPGAASIAHVEVTDAPRAPVESPAVRPVFKLSSASPAPSANMPAQIEVPSRAPFATAAPTLKPTATPRPTPTATPRPTYAPLSQGSKGRKSRPCRWN